MERIERDRSAATLESFQKHYSRRRVLTLGIEAAGAISASRTLNKVEATKFIELLLTQDQYSSSFLIKRGYQDPSQQVICMGDSNMIGVVHESEGMTQNAVSLGYKYADELKRGYDHMNPRVDMVAKSGARIPDVRDIQIPQAASCAASYREYDVFLNVSGNDVGQIISSPKEVERTNKATHNILQIDAIHLLNKLQLFFPEVEKRYADLTDDIFENFEGKMKHMVAFLLPDFSIADSITSPEINGQIYHFDLNGKLVPLIVRKMVLQLNNRMIQTLERQQIKHPDTPIIAVNPVGFGRDGFQNDQHYSPHGVEQIVRSLIKRTHFSQVLS